MRITSAGRIVRSPATRFSLTNVPCWLRSVSLSSPSRRTSSQCARDTPACSPFSTIEPVPPGPKSRRDLRIDLDNAIFNVTNNPPSALLTKRELQAEVAYLTAQIAEETRVYNNLANYAGQLGIPNAEVQVNAQDMARALQELRTDLQKAQAALAAIPC